MYRSPSSSQSPRTFWSAPRQGALYLAGYSNVHAVVRIAGHRFYRYLYLSLTMAFFHNFDGNWTLDTIKLDLVHMVLVVMDLFEVRFVRDWILSFQDAPHETLDYMTT